MMNSENTPPDGGQLIFARYITKNGKRIYPKNSQFFRFYVKPKPQK